VALSFYYGKNTDEVVREIALILRHGMLQPKA
jgi:hypothetical protein